MPYGDRMARLQQQSPKTIPIGQQAAEPTGLHPLVSLAHVLARSAALEFVANSKQLDRDSGDSSGTNGVQIAKNAARDD